MRDIRADLRERMESLSGRESEISREYGRLLKEAERWADEQMKLVQEERAAIFSLLNIEQRRHGEQADVPIPHIQLPDFLVQETAKRGIASKEDLRLAAVHAGYFPDGESGGRQIHATLMNLVRGNKIIETQSGRYGVPDPNAGMPGPIIQMEFAS